jgi:hypothetical protein
MLVRLSVVVTYFLFVKICVFFIYLFIYFLQLSSLLLGITDPFVPFENLFCAVVMGGLFDVIQVGGNQRTRISKKKTMLFAVVGMGSVRKTREGRPLLTVATEANGDSGSTYERVLPWLFRWARRYKRFLSCLGSSSRPSTKYFLFLTEHYFTSFVPVYQQAGQAIVQVQCCLSLNMFLWAPPLSVS